MSTDLASVTKTQRRLARNRADTVRALAAAQDAGDADNFAQRDIGPLTAGLKRFREFGVVRTVETGDDVTHYRVADDALALADEVVADREPICPCGHGGLQTRDDYWTCAFEWCPNTYARADLEVGE